MLDINALSGILVLNNCLPYVPSERLFREASTIMQQKGQYNYVAQTLSPFSWAFSFHVDDRRIYLQQ